MTAKTKMPPMSAPNWENRTMWTGDNLAVMRGLNSASVDLIYLDSPSTRTRPIAPPLARRQQGPPSRTRGRSTM